MNLKFNRKRSKSVLERKFIFRLLLNNLIIRKVISLRE